MVIFCLVGMLSPIVTHYLNKDYFALKDDPFFTEQTAREIAKLLGTKESYKTDAYQHYLEKFNLNFSDQELYDYFVATYPDLYGEDD